MENRILLAFDDSENAMRAAEYVAGAFSPDSRITLFGVVPDTAAMCEMNSPELTPYFKSEQIGFCSLEEKKRELLQGAMERAKTFFMEAGFDESHITLKVQAKKSGIARDIVRESASGYNLIVLGRRGFSGVKEFFLGSISQKVLHAAKDVSVLLVN